MVLISIICGLEIKLSSTAQFSSYLQGSAAHGLVHKKVASPHAAVYTLESRISLAGTIIGDRL